MLVRRTRFAPRLVILVTIVMCPGSVLCCQGYGRRDDGGKYVDGIKRIESLLDEAISDIQSITNKKTGRPAETINGNQYYSLQYVRALRSERAVPLLISLYGAPMVYARAVDHGPALVTVDIAQILIDIGVPSVDGILRFQAKKDNTTDLVIMRKQLGICLQIVGQKGVEKRVELLGLAENPAVKLFLKCNEDIEEGDH